MNSIVEFLNTGGGRLWHFAGPMLLQSSLLIAAMFALDRLFRRKIRAAIRYAAWLIVLVKLLVPPTLAFPTGAAWWLRHSESKPLALQSQTTVVVHYGPMIAPPVFPKLQPITPLKISLSASGWVFLVWGIVSAGLFGWMLSRWFQVKRAVRRATSPAENFYELLDETRRACRLEKGVRLRWTENAMSPAVCGLFRPVILLPRALTEKLATAQLRAVLLHEMIHLKRRDVWVNCAQALIQIVYWWHPLLWFANARIRRVREEAVDDAVMLALRDDSETYAPTLLEVAKLALNRPLASLGLVGILESRNALRQRIERLIHFPVPRKAGVSVISLIGLAAFTAVALPMGQAPEKSGKP
ncbi:MAG TPA: M56 family metallopeptidase, partial [Verrucomicrobiae bacterium]|nr:M56 family metallopeptidase [Verrucomicrobiae bacterium]